MTPELDNPLFEGGGGAAGGAAAGGAGGEAAPFGGAGGGGGGATEVFFGAAIDANRVIVAGGGGGGGGNNGPNLAGGNGGGGDKDGQNGTAPQSEGGHPGDAATQAGGIGDSANGFLAGGGAGGGGGGYQGGSQGATFLSSSGAGGGGGRSYLNPLLNARVDSAFSPSVEGDGSVVITYNQAFTTTTSIANPGTVVTQEMKGYAVHVAGNGGQAPVGSVKLTAKNLANGIITDLGTEALENQDATVYSDKLKVGNYTLSAEFIPAPGSDSLAIDRQGTPHGQQGRHDDLGLRASRPAELRRRRRSRCLGLPGRSGSGCPDGHGQVHLERRGARGAGRP